MTIEYLSSKRIQGVTGDTKPTNVPTGTEFMNTQTRVLSIFNGTTWDDVTGGGGGATNLDSLTDVTITSPANGQVPTYNSSTSQWENAAPPGAGGGEANILGNVGTGEGTLPGTKVGTTLNVKSLKQGTNITLTNNTNDVTITSAYPPDATTTVKGIAELATDGENAANVVVQGNDARLSNSRTPTTHKSSHVSGGGDTFVKGDDLVAAARYLEDVADPASDAQRIWIEDATANLKYWSDEGSPVKHTVATASSTATFTNKTFDADGTGNSITNIENADIKAAAAIAYSKLNLTGGIVNADVNASAGIVTTKLADSTNFILKTLDNSFGAHYHDITKMTAPGNPAANDLRVYVDTTDTHLKVKNSAGTVTDLQTTSSFTASSTDTLTNKTINPTNNTMPYTGSYSYTIYQDSGACKARNNKTGAIASNTNLDPLITTILASGNPSFEVQPGFYDLSTGFSGWNAVSHMEAFFHTGSTINVPNAFANVVWKFNPTDTVIWRASIEGGLWDEQGSQANNWTFLQFAPVSTNPPTTTGAVYDCRFKNIEVWNCDKVIHFKTTNKSWVTQSYFEHIYGEGMKYLFYGEHVGTYTANQSGMQENKFLDVSCQATGAGSGHAQVLGGFTGIFGQRNMFIGCTPWDVEAGNSSASTGTITTNASDNIIIGGLITSYQFSDTSTGGQTMINDSFQGFKHSRAEFTYNDPNPLIVYRPSTTTFDELGIQFDQKSSTGVRRTFGKLAVGDDDRTNGAEYTWWGVHYMINGALALRGAFYNNGLFFGPTTGTRVFIDNTGISGGNKVFTFPNLSGQFATINATQTLTNKTVGDLKETWQSKSAAYTMVDTDYGIFLTGTGTYTVTLPAASTRAGKIYKFIKTGASGTVTISRAGSDTINGATTQTITTQYQMVELVCDGTSWFLHRMAP